LVSYSERTKRTPVGKGSTFKKGGEGNEDSRAKQLSAMVERRREAHSFSSGKEGKGNRALLDQEKTGTRFIKTTLRP